MGLRRWRYAGAIPAPIVGAVVAAILGACGQSATPSTPSTPPAATSPSSPVSAPAASATPAPSPTAFDLEGRIVFDRLQGSFGYESAYVGTFVLGSGSAEKQLSVAPNIQEGVGPTWSADGSKLLIHIWAPPEVPGRSATVKADSTGLTMIEPKGLVGSLGCTSWSPDGSSVACSLDDDAHPNTEGIYTVGTDGSGLTQVTTSPYPSVEGSISSCGGNDFAPAWSPDGERIAFLRAQCGPGEDPSGGQQATLCVVNSDGSNLTSIVGKRLPNSHGFSRVRWSPDGTRILFGSEHGTLYLVNPDGSDLTEISLAIDDADAYAYTPDWSPDGAFIVFSLRTLGKTDLYVARPDGKDVAQLTDAPDAEVWASWTSSP
jgi:Tol biopolymer transport system component